jgi:6-phosphofructokinase 1
MAKKSPRRIGILTAGSDCSGLNAAIRAIGKTLQSAFGMQVVGFQDGFRGLVEDYTLPLEGNALSNILTTGGTILGTSRDCPHRFMQDGREIDRTDDAIETYHRHELEALVCIGGRETQDGALRLSQRGLNVITLPKAIDNDVAGTDRTIGFETAVEVAAQSIDRLHSTAHSLHRIIIVEMMGRQAGWLTLAAGLSSGADVILIPELPYDIHKVAEAVLRRNRAGKSFSIVAVSEHIISQEELSFRDRLRQINATLRSGEERKRIDQQLSSPTQDRSDSSFHVANRLKEFTGLETRITILGYLLRGGAPSANDRFLATRLGTIAASCVEQRRYGVMIALHGDQVEPVPLAESLFGHKPVPADHPWIESARRVGTSLGD